MLASFAFVASGCNLIESHRDIYGKWHTEGIALGGITLPLGPSLEFLSNKAVVNGSELSVDRYEKKDNQITVHLTGSAGLTFEIVDKDTMTFALPVMGKITYVRAP
jgi:hypothetical protein